MNPKNRLTAAKKATKCKITNKGLTDLVLAPQPVGIFSKEAIFLPSSKLVSRSIEMAATKSKVAAKYVVDLFGRHTLLLATSLDKYKPNVIFFYYRYDLLIVL